MMSGRRRFLLVASAPFALACAAVKSAERVWRIGVLHSTPLEVDGWEDFTTELRRRGYGTDRNLTFVKRQADPTEPGALDRAARELVELKVDLIYAYPGSPSALAAQRATATIPIVFHASGDPIGLGLVQSLAHPGKNVTGNYYPIIDVVPKSLQLLQEATGRLSRVAYLYSADSRSLPGQAGIVAGAESAARALGISVVHVDIGADMAQTLRELVAQGVDGVSVQGEGYGTDGSYWHRLAAALIAFRLPSIGFAEHGFLVFYAPSSVDLDLAAARYVAGILKGAKPASIPVEQVSTFDVEINLRTAAALGLPIPRSLLVRATRVVR